MAKEKTETAEILAPLERLTRLMRAGEHEGGLNPAQWEALRYLARANRFSNSPIALTRFLGSTKGTISQTIKALERKGFIAKSPRENEGRSICLTLTEKGIGVLTKDPLTELSNSLDELGGKTRRRLAKGLADLLETELERQEQPSFGTCSSCRYFREKGRETDTLGPHQCMLFDAGLTSAESQLICVEHS
ncbi:MAG: MarR family transcriptional regulator [Aestuariivirga sp.]